jgi:predicted anti-sigma-YlaC factor YlaD
MHEPVVQRLEEILRDEPAGTAAEIHLQNCAACRAEISSMKMQNRLFRAFQCPAEVEPSPGFYGRVINRIESQTAPSIWSLFSESLFATRLAYASMTFVALLGTYFISSTNGERPVVINSPEATLAVDDNQRIINNSDPDRDRAATLVTLASYQD